MTWTWTGNVDTDLQKVRHKIGDTDTDDQLLSDERINLEIAASDSLDSAAVLCVKRILAELARDVDRSGTRFSATRSQKYQHYRDLLKDLEADASSTALAAHWSEHSTADADSLEADSDFRNPRFKIGQDEY